MQADGPTARATIQLVSDGVSSCVRLVGVKRRTRQLFAFVWLAGLSIHCTARRRAALPSQDGRLARKCFPVPGTGQSGSSRRGRLAPPAARPHAGGPRVRGRRRSIGARVAWRAGGGSACAARHDCVSLLDSLLGRRQCCRMAARQQHVTIMPDLFCQATAADRCVIRVRIKGAARQDANQYLVWVRGGAPSDKWRGCVRMVARYLRRRRRFAMQTGPLVGRVYAAPRRPSRGRGRAATQRRQARFVSPCPCSCARAHCARALGGGPSVSAATATGVRILGAHASASSIERLVARPCRGDEYK